MSRKSSLKSFDYTVLVTDGSKFNTEGTEVAPQYIPEKGTGTVLEKNAANAAKSALEEYFEAIKDDSKQMSAVSINVIVSCKE